MNNGTMRPTDQARKDPALSKFYEAQKLLGTIDPPSKPTANTDGAAEPKKSQGDAGEQSPPPESPK